MATQQIAKRYVNGFEEVRPTCPDCGKPLIGLITSEAATFEYTRTCRNCKSRWRILARPSQQAKKTLGMRIHVLNLFRVETVR